MVQGTLSLLWMRGALLRGHASGTRYAVIGIPGALLQGQATAVQGNLILVRARCCRGMLVVLGTLLWVQVRCCRGML